MGLGSWFHCHAKDPTQLHRPIFYFADNVDFVGIGYTQYCQVPTASRRCPIILLELDSASKIAGRVLGPCRAPCILLMLLAGLSSQRGRLRAISGYRPSRSEENVVLTSSSPIMSTTVFGFIRAKFTSVLRCAKNWGRTRCHHTSTGRANREQLWRGRTSKDNNWPFKPSARLV